MKPISAAKAPVKQARTPTTPFATRNQTGSTKSSAVGRNNGPAHQNRASATKRTK